MNHWDKKHADTELESQQPVQVLKDYQHLLPAKGTALDYACGLGRNALFLARCGFDVLGWDSSTVAIKRLQQYADLHNLPIRAEVRDLEQQDMPACFDSFDVLVVSYYLYRPAFPKLLHLLKPEGLLFYQTFIQDSVDSSGPSNPDYRLGNNELLALCESLRVLAYREEGSAGSITTGLRNEAYLVGQRPGPECKTFKNG